jgi:hypothetical protein
MIARRLEYSGCSCISDLDQSIIHISCRLLDSAMIVGLVLLVGPSLLIYSECCSVVTGLQT